MKPMKFPKEQREQLISQIQHYFETERGETLGHLAAEGMLDFFVENLGPYLYNQALSDCRTVVSERMLSLEEDIYALEKTPKRTR
ncbi:hypothetical protein JCM10914A_16040 [Paenibacillus sp. JCM 10914]|uniref:DUF2164 domain-containing protein n=1 Tax=Paenibacillus sp. JCM 10914 TaxID=1236974 RepID=UPI0003CC38BB|nr:DUF2164 domain-containing protein [Paenibacillus sp. JCM 10914]GAE06746.1 hypothetical protein JCM10914_2921 [Paenibacillus sp. JCM 10914]